MKTEDEKLQAHGLTVAQMRNLQYQQINEPEKIKMIPGNNAGDKITDEYFAKDYADYKLPAHEAHCYHVVTEARTFKSGGAQAVRDSIAIVHKMTKEAYEFHKGEQKGHSGFAGQIVHILHNPLLPSLDEEQEHDEDDLISPVDTTAKTAKTKKK